MFDPVPGEVSREVTCSTTSRFGYQERQINDCDGQAVQFERKLCTDLVEVLECSE